MKGLRTIILTAMMAGCGAVSTAVANQGTTLVVLLKDGTQQTFLLQDRPTMTFAGDSLLMDSRNVQTGYLRSEVQDFHFTYDYDAIDDVAQQELRFTWQMADVLLIQGLRATDAAISVYSLDGQRLPAAVSQWQGGVRVSLAQCPGGIYIIRIGNRQTIKIKKK